MNDLKHVRGVVEATAQNAPDRYGLRVAGEWFDGFGSCPVEKGDEVELGYADNGRFHNVKLVRLVGSNSLMNGENGAEESAEQNSADSRIARAVALKCAVAMWSNSSGGVPRPDIVLQTAEKFQEWLRATSRN